MNLPITMNTKGQGLVIAGLLYLILCVALIFMIWQTIVTEPIGTKQYDILITNEKADTAQIYIDKSIELAAEEARQEFVRNSGRYVEPTELGTVTQNPCGEHIYISYTGVDEDGELQNCIPNYIANYITYVQSGFSGYINSYPLFPLDFSHRLQVDPEAFQTRITAQITQDLKLPLGTLSQLYDDGQDQIYPSSPLGGYGNEKPVTCATGTCFSEVGELFYELYNLDGTNLPYVWGGESPYTYDDSVELIPEPRSVFFDYGGLTRTEPARPNRISRLTVPGFDCSGWIWWVGKHANIPGLTQRLTANGYLENARLDPTTQAICDETSETKCTEEFVLENAQPGDILFYAGNRGEVATHIMLYTGEGEILHSRASSGLVKEPLTEYYFTDTIAVYRYPYEQTGLQTLNDLGKVKTQINGPIPQPIPIPSLGADTEVSEEGERCVLPVDLSQIDLSVIDEGKQPSALEVTQKLAAAGLIPIIQDAHRRYPNIPEQVIIAFITKETGGVIDDYIAKRETCNSGGFCGLMQVGEDACDEVNRFEPDTCNYNAMKAGNLEIGIISGTAYLNYLMDNYNDVQYPDYYWLAIAYNAGPGSMEKIQETVSNRLRSQGQIVPEEIVQWSDTTFSDIETAMNNLGPRWAKKADKHKEIWEYGHYTGFALGEQCDGSLLAGLRTRRGRTNSFLFYTPEIDYTTNLDLLTINKVTQEFIPNIQGNCTDNLINCVNGYVDTYSAETFFDVNVTTGRESESLALSIVDQAIDCQTNGQEDCYCDITVDPMLVSEYDDVALEFLDDGTVMIGQETSLALHYVADTKTLVRLPYTFTRDALDLDDQHSKVEFFMDEEVITVELDELIDTTHTSKDNDVWGIGLYKDSVDSTAWAPLKSEHKARLCRDNKHMFRFEANINTLPEPLQFSLYLNDTTSPLEVELNQAQKHRCGVSKQAILFSWSVPKGTEKIHEFTLYENKGGQQIPFHTMLAESYDLPAANIETTRDTFKLYAQTTPEGVSYYTVIDKDSEGNQINASTYSFSILAEDQYENKAFIKTLNGETQTSITLSDQLITLPASQLGVILAEDCRDVREPNTSLLGSLAR